MILGNIWGDNMDNVTWNKTQSTDRKCLAHQYEDWSYGYSINTVTDWHLELLCYVLPTDISLFKRMLACTTAEMLKVTDSWVSSNYWWCLRLTKWAIHISYRICFCQSNLVCVYVSKFLHSGFHTASPFPSYVIPQSAETSDEISLANLKKWCRFTNVVFSHKWSQKCWRKSIEYFLKD